MKERPILMTAPMVRALLAGKKTQTRRPVKRILPVGAVDPRGYWGPLKEECLMDKDHLPSSLSAAPTNLCPYGEPGDRLWVRETWRPYSWSPNELTLQMRADNRVVDVELPDTNEAESWLDRLCESAAHDCQKQAIQEEDGQYVWDGEEDNPIKWRPSIFMPRWASRITLEITDVRVQRLQEISAEDARAEGWGVAFGPGHFSRAFDSFWDSIHGAGSWAANPWVWALTFKVVKPQKGSI